MPSSGVSEDSDNVLIYNKHINFFLKVYNMTLRKGREISVCLKAERSGMFLQGTHTEGRQAPTLLPLRD